MNVIKLNCRFGLPLLLAINALELYGLGRGKQATPPTRTMPARAIVTSQNKTLTREQAKASAAASIAELRRLRDKLRENAVSNHSVPALAEALASPETFAVLVRSLASRLDRSYFPLYSDLPPPVAQRLRTLIAEKELGAAEMFVLTSDLGPAARADLLARYRATEDEKVRQEVGSEVFATYKTYEVRLPYRQQAEALAQHLSFTEEPIDSKTIDRVTTALAGADNNPVPAAAYLGAYVNLGSVTEAQLQAAKAVLSPAQFNVLNGIVENAKAGQAVFSAVKAAQQNRSSSENPKP